MIISKKILQKVIIILSFCLMIAIFVLFKTKFHVEQLTRNLTLILSEIEQKKLELEILEAEINYLTTPSRIEELTEKYLQDYKLK